MLTQFFEPVGQIFVCYFSRCVENLTAKNKSHSANVQSFNPLTPTVATWVHPVPDGVKPSFVIYDIRALWRSWLYSYGNWTVGVKLLTVKTALTDSVRLNKLPVKKAAVSIFYFIHKKLLYLLFFPVLLFVILQHYLLQFQ